MKSACFGKGQTGTVPATPDCIQTKAAQTFALSVQEEPIPQRSDAMAGHRHRYQGGIPRRLPTSDESEDGHSATA